MNKNCNASKCLASFLIVAIIDIINKVLPSVVYPISLISSFNSTLVKRESCSEIHRILN